MYDCTPEYVLSSAIEYIEKLSKIDKQIDEETTNNNETVTKIKSMLNTLHLYSDNVKQALTTRQDPMSSVDSVLYSIIYYKDAYYFRDEIINICELLMEIAEDACGDGYLDSESEYMICDLMGPFMDFADSVKIILEDINYLKRYMSEIIDRIE